MTKIDLATVDQIIRDVGVSEIIPRFRKLAEGDVEMKGIDDPVTVADKEAERHLTERLTKYLPGSIVVGEETFAKDKSILSRLDSSEPVWIIDPIDGTRNFVGGKPEFATMVALIKNRTPIASWIHDPNSGDTILAEKGSGVWLRGKRMTLAANDGGLPPIMLMGSRVKKLISDPSIMPNSLNMPPIEVGSCASFDYPRLFSGEVSFANAQSNRAAFLLYRHTNAWDHVPGLLLHTEAGGYHADWSGNAYDYGNFMSGLLYAPNKDEWQRVHTWLAPLMEYTRKKAS